MEFFFRKTYKAYVEGKVSSRRIPRIRRLSEDAELRRATQPELPLLQSPIGSHCIPPRRNACPLRYSPRCSAVFIKITSFSKLCADSLVLWQILFELHIKIMLGA